MFFFFSSSFFFECVCMCVLVCICECVGLYVRVGFFIVPGGYGFGKANLGLRALGPCQAHQQISYAIRYRTTAAFNAHMRKHANLFSEHSHSLKSDSSYDTLYVGTSCSLCVSCHSCNQIAYLLCTLLTQRFL